MWIVVYIYMKYKFLQKNSWYLVGVRINLGPRPLIEILVPIRGYFQNFRRAPPSLLYGSPRPGTFTDKTHNIITLYIIFQMILQ